MKIQHFTTVDNNGTLIIRGLKDLIGKPVRATIEPKIKRSLNQNSFFHGVVIPIVKEHLLDLGWREARSAEWVKNYIKFNCLITESINENTGEIIKSLGETSGLSKIDFVDFIADVQQWAIEKLDLYIPSPNEQMEINGV